MSDNSGNTICNACGLYYRLHGVYRPVRLKKGIIKRRKRNRNKSSEEELEQTSLQSTELPEKFTSRDSEHMISPYTPRTMAVDFTKSFQEPRKVMKVESLLNEEEQAERPRR
ncbi:hypothetical protein FOA43_002349 [Brettanomyces nanus]|uniref:GATA-type domain-containing protein n=1 Tax=Eeniella nana TaxID=13502 RepID=A0A875S5H6_EENNA|nr:uncharacterized protein FOA43_002349 [Brettanomyces nanus]QPG75009.1 hypothetical protein FOA43_002349 [Brettanomyces nanus]